MNDWSPVPWSYVLNGSAFKYAAEALVEKLDIDELGIPKKQIASPLYFLFSQSAELFLKAVLLKQGKTESFLKKFDYRHNLSALLNELESIDMAVSEKTKKVINMLSQQHSKHVLRYNPYFGNEVKIYWTPIPETLDALDELMLLSRKPRPEKPNNQMQPTPKSGTAD